MLYPVVIVFAFLFFGFGKIRNMFNSNFTITIILILVFFNGIIDMFRIPPFYVNLLIESLVFLLLIYTISITNKETRNFQVPGIRIFGIFSIVLLISVYINDSDLYISYLYYRFFLTPYLVMLIIVNIKMSEKDVFKLISFIEYLFVFQLIATVIKLVLLGRPEHPVGTIIVAGGGVATYLPLIAAGFLLARFYLYKKEKIYIYLLLGFPLIAFASQKRGAFIFMPFVFLVIVFLLNRTDPKSNTLEKSFKYLVSLSIIALFLLMFASKTTSTMNPEKSGSGTFDPGYLFESSVQYNSMEGKYTLGRFASFKQVNKVIGGSEFSNKFFGYGPETLKGVTRDDGRFEKFGVAGTYPGISYQLIQIGIVGAGLWALFYFFYGIRIFRIMKKEKSGYWKSFAMGSLVMIFLFFIDYITYSATFITVYALTFTISIAFGLLLKRQNMLRERDLQNIFNKVQGNT